MTASSQGILFSCRGIQKPFCDSWTIHNIVRYSNQGGEMLPGIKHEESHNANESLYAET